MDQRERFDDFEEMIRAAMDARQASLWTSLPAVVVSVDFAKQTASLQPAVKSVIRKPNGTQEVASLPLLEDVPLHFPCGGGMTLTFPVTPGDEALVVFAARSTDAWLQSGAEQKQIDARMHDLSDGFAIVGFKSNPKALQNVSSEATELRSDDGTTKVSMHPASGISITTPNAVAVTASQGVTISGGSGNTTITGDLHVSGDVLAGTISLKKHIHSGVQRGGGNTDQPVA